MKIIVVKNNYSVEIGEKNQGWYLLADSAMTNTGKPFFLPENCGNVMVYLGMAVKINRLGKHIEEKFAHRYYDQYAPVVHFVFESEENLLLSRGLPGDEARNFDRSLFVGEFKALEDMKPIGFRYNGEFKSVFDADKLKISIDEVIHRVSRLNTMKIGDLIVPGLISETYIKEGDFLEVLTGEEVSFNVKVK